MSDPHAHHHARASAHAHDSEGTAAPTEPGYPHHPEVAGQDQARPHGEHHHASDTGRGAAGDHGGHDTHAGHSVAMFRDKFWISLALTVPTLVWGHMLQRALGYTAPHFAGAMWIPALFGSAVFFYG